MRDEIQRKKQKEKIRKKLNQTHNFQQLWVFYIFLTQKNLDISEIPINFAEKNVKHYAHARKNQFKLCYLSKAP